jgi:hypothetical protein
MASQTEYYSSTSSGKLHHARWHSRSRWATVDDLGHFLARPTWMSYAVMFAPSPYFIAPKGVTTALDTRFPATGTYVNLSVHPWKGFITAIEQRFLPARMIPDLWDLQCDEEMTALYWLARDAARTHTGVFDRKTFEDHYSLLWLPFSWRAYFSKCVLPTIRPFGPPEPPTDQTLFLRMIETLIGNDALVTVVGDLSAF